MANLILPDPRIEMPELLEPGRKPVGPVEIDWSHPLTRGLAMFYLLGSGHTRNLVNDTGDEFASYSDYTTQTAHEYTSGGLAIPAGADPYLRLNGDYDQFRALPKMSAGFGMLYNADVSSTSTAYFTGFAQKLYNISASGYTNWNVSFAKYAARTGAFARVATAYARSDASGFGVTDMVPGNHYNIVTVSDSSPASTSVYMNGKHEVTEAIDARATADSNGFIGVNEPGNPLMAGTVVHWVGLWTRKLTAHEAKSITKNLYQILIPA